MARGGAADGDSSAPHCLLTLRATHTRCPTALTARFACALYGAVGRLAYLRITIYDLDASALCAGGGGGRSGSVAKFSGTGVKGS